MTGRVEKVDDVSNGRSGLMELMATLKDGAGDIAPIGLSLERLLQQTERESDAS